MIDKLTGWAKAIPIPYQFAATVARVMHAEWIAQYDVPNKLHPDYKVHFKAAVFADHCATFGIEKTSTTPYRFQAKKIEKNLTRLW